MSGAGARVPLGARVAHMSERVAVPALAAWSWLWFGRLLGSGFAVYLRSMPGLLLVWHLVALSIGNPALLPSPWLVAQDLYRLLSHFAQLVQEREAVHFRHQQAARINWSPGAGSRWSAPAG